MDVLFISLAFPPFAESQTIRSAYLLKRLSEVGFRISVVTAEVTPNNQDATLCELLPPNYAVTRTPPAPYDRRIRRLARSPGGRWLTYIYANLAYRLGIPDQRSGWASLAFRAGEKAIAESRPDLIMSAHGSCTAHVAAHKLAKKYSIPWVAELGDPWSALDFARVSRWPVAIVNRYLEVTTVCRASGLVFTTEETLAAYKRWRGSALPPAVSIPYGYRASDFQEASPSVEAGLPIALSHVGVAYQSNRNLIPAIRALEQIERRQRGSFRLNIVGPHSASFPKEAARLGLDCVTFTARVSYRDSIQWILRSSLLLIIGNRGPLQVPGKVYVYLASGRPILYVHQRPPASDPAFKILSAFPGVVYADNTDASIKQALLTVRDDFDSMLNEAAERNRMPQMRQLEGRFIGDRLADFLHRVHASAPDGIRSGAAD